MRTENGDKTSKSVVIARIALFVVLLIISAQLRIQITAVAFTMQTAVLFLCGACLKPRQAALTASVYVAAGLIGLPVFAEGGGIAYVLKPSFGYLLGFIPCVCAFSAIFRRRLTYLGAILTGIIGLVVLYAIGLPYSWAIMKYILTMPTEGILTALSIMPLYFIADIAFIIVISTAHKQLRLINKPQRP